jgi:hypothetical protein
MYTLSAILVMDWFVHRQASCIYIHIFVYGDTVNKGLCSSSMDIFNSFGKVIFWNIDLCCILCIFYGCL